MKTSRYCSILLLILSLLLSGCSAFREKEKEPEMDHILMTIDGEPVYEAEGRLYLEMIRLVYEKNGGEEIWDIPLNGRDSIKTASDQALDSLIRTKVAAREFDAARLNEADLRNIDRVVIKLETAIGESRLKGMGLSEEDLRRCMEESYRAFRFERSMTFLPGSMESELDAKVAEAFIAYEAADTDLYLQKVSIDAIMIYTGEWIDGVWVTYPATEREEKYALMEEAYQRVQNGGQFALTRNWYSEDQNLLDSPVFSAGVVMESKSDNTLYRGQILDEIAEAIFKTPSGETTGILETPYGYVLVKVGQFSKPGYLDYTSYEEQLAKAQEEYRTALIKELEQEQLEAEYVRLLEDADVNIHQEVWDRIAGF